MKNLVLLTFALLLSVSAHANIDNASYLGIGAGNLLVNRGDIDSDVILGKDFILGYIFSNTVSLELAHTTGKKSDVKASINDFPFEGDLRLKTTALYAVYRTTGPLFYLLKAGILQETVDLYVQYCGMIGGSNTCISGTESSRDTGLSIGVGAGWRLGDSIAIESEFSIIEQDVNYLSFGLNYRF
ncbi:MAG: hypothetical protein COA99_17640 [Moraxellaceae bacterium]|nr:MAG: hypothetical protein COA99_17640 [Moraxellaceae bacterium]